ncbi:uncharacterized protein J3R85_008165 [Psidium guajava]|nr:uncharacterized protein J3R85_008165 [Psidium guajava]
MPPTGIPPVGRVIAVIWRDVLRRRWERRRRVLCRALSRFASVFTGRSE